jgi:hypothetical protein
MAIGIDALPGWILSANTADRNGDLGIGMGPRPPEIPPITDGGGNRAKHNGNPLQCLNIFCNTNGPRK